MGAVVSSFLSYIVLFIVLVALAICGALIGIHLAKRKNAKEAAVSAAQETTDEE